MAWHTTPLREALSRLRSERLVVSVAMCGFSVAPLSLPVMQDATHTQVLIDTLHDRCTKITWPNTAI